MDREIININLAVVGYAKGVKATFLKYWGNMSSFEIIIRYSTIGKWYQ